MLQLAARQIIGKLLNAIIDKFERVRATLNANRPATGFHCWTDSINDTIRNVITSVVTERDCVCTSYWVRLHFEWLTGIGFPTGYCYVTLCYNFANQVDVNKVLFFFLAMDLIDNYIYFNNVHVRLSTNCLQRIRDLLSRFSFRFVVKMGSSPRNLKDTPVHQVFFRPGCVWPLFCYF